MPISYSLQKRELLWYVPSFIVTRYRECGLLVHVCKLVVKSEHSSLFSSFSSPAIVSSAILLPFYPPIPLIPPPPLGNGYRAERLFWRSKAAIEVRLLFRHNSHEMDSE